MIDGPAMNIAGDMIPFWYHDFQLCYYPPSQGVYKRPPPTLSHFSSLVSLEKTSPP